MMSAGVADGDTLTGTVPACVDQVCLGANLVHLLHQFLSILRRVQAQESGTEASGEGRSRLGDAALCTCQLGSEAGEEVILGSALR